MMRSIILGNSFSHPSYFHHASDTLAVATQATSGIMGNSHPNSYGSNGNDYNPQRVEELVLNTPLDIERTMASTTKPKSVTVQASLLSQYGKGTTVEKVLKRVGCLDLTLQGKSEAAPRRLFEHEVVSLLCSVKSTRLQSLSLKSLDIQRGFRGTNSRLPSLKERLLKCQQLQALHLQCCRIDDALVEELLEVLPMLPRLTQVSWQLADDMDHTSSLRTTSTTASIASTMTEEEEQHQQQLHDKLVETMTHLLQRKYFCRRSRQYKTYMTHLALSEFPHDDLFWKHVSLSQSLTHLCLTLRHQDQEEDHVAQCHAHCKCCCWQYLQQNRSIQQLELHLEAGVSMQPLLQLLKNHNTNDTITHLILHLDEDPTLIRNELTTVLEKDNFTLVSVRLLCHNIYGYEVRIPSPNLDFFTKLNRQGRQRLVRSTHGRSNQEWIRAMSHNTFDASASYYWLHSNLTLFSHMLAKNNTGNGDEKTRRSTVGAAKIVPVVA